MSERMKQFAVLMFLFCTVVLNMWGCMLHKTYGQQKAKPKPLRHEDLSEDLKAVLRVKMGEVLFFDKSLSQDQSVSCATCHNPKLGFSDGQRTAIGIGNQAGRRNTPSIYTAAFHPLQFPDGRTVGVDTQSLLPLTNPIEMGNGSVRQVVNRVSPKYDRLSRLVYGKSFDADVMANAIANYEMSIFSVTMPVNKRMEGYRMTFADDPQAERGYQLFVSKQCMRCHVPPLFTDVSFHNTGISFITQDSDRGRIGILPQGSPQDSTSVRAFKTPTLQGVGASAPYTHAGNVPDLLTMVKAYNAGMIRVNRNNRRVIDPMMDERIRPLHMTDRECEDLAHFLEVGFVNDVQTAVPRQ